MHTKYYFFVGTRAELIKLFPLIELFLKEKNDFIIISSGQNDLTKDEIFINLNLNEKTVFLSKGEIKKNMLGLLSWWLKTFFTSKKKLELLKLNEVKNKIFIVHGDTISTVMGAFLGKIYKAKVAHIEAGLRSFDIFSPFPEELDRLLVSMCSDIHFAPNKESLNNLKNVKGYKINTFNNTLLDSLYSVLTKKSSNYKTFNQIKKESFFIFVMHRQENLADLKFVKNVLKLINNYATKNEKCLMILHDNTRYVLEKNNFFIKINCNKNIKTVSRLNYSELMKIIKLSKFVITDGGSNQEECYYFGKPCCILRKKTERTEGLDKNVFLSKNNLSKIEFFLRNYKSFSKSQIKLTNSPSKIIFNTLIKK